MRDIGVLYLCRFHEGEAPVRRFLASYRRHASAADHDLHVLFKGFPDRRALAAARALFDGTPIAAIELDDGGFDIGSYLAGARRVDNPRVLLLNTFAEILA